MLKGETLFVFRETNGRLRAMRIARYVPDEVFEPLIKESGAAAWDVIRSHTDANGTWHAERRGVGPDLVREAKRQGLWEEVCRIEEELDSELKIVQSRPPDFPAVWRGIGWFLPPGVRRRTFEPAVNQLIDDYLAAVSECRHGRRRRSTLILEFTCQTVWLVLGCFWEECKDYVDPWLKPRA